MCWAKYVEPYQSPTAVTWSGPGACLQPHQLFTLAPQTTCKGKMKVMKKNQTEVGYGRPPIEHRFRPGQSGNPSGRPKGARRFTADLLDELDEIVAVSSGDQKRAVTKQRAIVNVLVSKALKGDPHAIATIISACARALGEQHVDDEPEAPEDRAILRAVAEFSREQRQQPASQ